MFQKIALVFVLWLGFSASAFAQSGCNSIATGAVLTAAQWNACFAGKQDVLGYVPLNSAGGTMSGKLTAAAPGAAASGFNTGCGTAPTSPINGDLWCTAVGMFARINGTTIQLAATSSAVTCTASGATPVTCNGGGGVVTTNSLTLAAGASANYVINNSVAVAPTAMRMNCTLMAYSGTLGANGYPTLALCRPGAGTITITVINEHATNALNGTLQFGFGLQAN